MSAFSFPFSGPFGSGFSFLPGPGGSSLASLNPTAPGSLSSQIDQLIDPNTGDYVRTDNGEWSETADSRTTMLLMLEIEFGASPFDPSDGTTLGALRRNGDPITPEILRSETLRAGGVLQAAGILADLEVSVRDGDGNVIRDQSGRTLVLAAWRDLSSGSPVDLLLQPG